MEKSPDAFRTISEVSEWLETPAHVLRFWESRFAQVKPVKRAGGRRYYRPSDMLLLGGIKKLLHEDGMTIRGVQKILREQGVKHVAGLSQPLEEAAEQAALEVAPAPQPETQAKPAAEPEPESGAEPATGAEPEAEEPPAVEMQRKPEAPAAPSAAEQASTNRPSNVVPLAPATSQPDLFVGHKTEPAAEATPEPEKAQPAPLGTGLPSEDPADDSLPAKPSLRARLRDPSLRRRLAARHPQALASALVGLTDLRDRLGKGE